MGDVVVVTVDDLSVPMFEPDFGVTIGAPMFSLESIEGIVMSTSLSRGFVATHNIIAVLAKEEFVYSRATCSIAGKERQ